YSTYLGGSGLDAGIACDIDREGDLYLVGATTSDDFPTTPGVVQPDFNGGDGSLCSPDHCDGYAAKLSPDGSTLIYSTYVGGTGDEWLTAARVDLSGDAFAMGDSSSTDFPTTPGAFRNSNAGGKAKICLSACDEVLIKLNPMATNFIYSTYVGGPGDEC